MSNIFCTKKERSVGARQKITEETWKEIEHIYVIIKGQAAWEQTV
jgi:hypothetical protein